MRWIPLSPLPRLLGTDPRTGEIFLCRQEPEAKTVGIVLTIVATAAISSLVLTTSGTGCCSRGIISYDYSGQTVQFALLVPIYCVLTCFLYFSPLTFLVMDTVKPAVLKKKTV